MIINHLTQTTEVNVLTQNVYLKKGPRVVNSGMYGGR